MEESWLPVKHAPLVSLPLKCLLQLPTCVRNVKPASTLRKPQWPPVSAAFPVPSEMMPKVVRWHRAVVYVLQGDSKTCLVRHSVNSVKTHQTAPATSRSQPRLPPVTAISPPKILAHKPTTPAYALKAIIAVVSRIHKLASARSAKRE